MSIIVKIKRDTQKNWETSNPVLTAGELACDISGDEPIWKLGDGVHNWSDLKEVTQINEIKEFLMVGCHLQQGKVVGRHPIDVKVLLAPELVEQHNNQCYHEVTNEN